MLPRRPAVVPMDPPREDGYLSLQHLSQYADVSVRTLRTYLTDSENPLPHYKMHGKILVRRSEFDTWMRTFRVEQDDALADMVDDVMEALR